MLSKKRQEHEAWDLESDHDPSEPRPVTEQLCASQDLMVGRVNHVRQAGGDQSGSGERNFPARAPTHPCVYEGPHAWLPQPCYTKINLDASDSHQPQAT